MSIEKIEKFAKSLCDTDQEDPHLYEDHVQLVRKYAVELAKIEKADIFVCEIAALLHDNRKVQREEKSSHNRKSSRRKIFRTFHYSRRKKEPHPKVYLQTQEQVLI